MHVQTVVADLRTRQQALIEQAVRASKMDLAAIADVAPIVWGAAVDSADLARLDRWARSSAFRLDLTTIVRRLAPVQAGQQMQPGAITGAEEQSTFGSIRSVFRWVWRLARHAAFRIHRHDASRATAGVRQAYRRSY